jgi:hypothetical protein
MDTRDLLAHTADALGMDTADKDGHYTADALAENITDDVLETASSATSRPPGCCANGSTLPCRPGCLASPGPHTRGHRLGDAKRIVAAVNAPQRKGPNQ